MCQIPGLSLVTPLTVLASDWLMSHWSGPEPDDHTPALTAWPTVILTACSSLTGIKTVFIFWSPQCRDNLDKRRLDKTAHGEKKYLVLRQHFSLFIQEYFMLWTFSGMIVYEQNLCYERFKFSKPRKLNSAASVLTVTTQLSNSESLQSERGVSQNDDERDGKILQSFYRSNCGH